MQTSIEQLFSQQRTHLDLQASKEARRRAKSSRWSIDTVILLLMSGLVTLMMNLAGTSIDIAVPAGFVGLITVAAVVWRREKQLYRRFYDEELATYNSTMD